MKRFSALFLILISAPIFGQDLHLIERELVKFFIKAEYYPHNPLKATKKDGSVEDSVFQAKFLEITGTIPGTLTYPFDSLKLLNLYLTTGSIFSSNDSSARIYCLRSRNYFQYKFGDGVRSILLPVEKGALEFRRGYRNLYSFSDNKKTYYLGIYLFADGEGVRIFSINPKGSVDTLPLFKTKEGMKNKIMYHAKNCRDNPDGYIYFDALNKVLYMPVTNDSGELEKKPEAYKFNGKFFKKSGK